MSKAWRCGIAWVMVAWAWSGSAWAQDPAPADSGLVAYDFDDDQVQGDLRQPLGERLEVRTRKQRASLVQARMHFVPELMKTALDM
jgi:hypothetical protein